MLALGRKKKEPPSNPIAVHAELAPVLARLAEVVNDLRDLDDRLLREAGAEPHDD